MKKLILAFAAVALMTAAPRGAEDVSGTWKLAVDSPHGDVPMSLVLKQDGTKVSGTFVSGMAPDAPVEGEFVDRTLKVESSGDMKVTFHGTMKDDGTLAGFVSTEMGDMKWTGTRVKDGK